MKLNHEITGDGVLSGLMQQAGVNASRAVGKAFGAGADAIADDVERELQSRGWTNTSEVRARRGSGGPFDPSAYVFLEGGAAWHEEGTSRIPPNPVLGPAADRRTEEIMERAAAEVHRLL